MRSIAQAVGVGHGHQDVAVGKNLAFDGGVVVDCEVVADSDIGRKTNGDIVCGTNCDFNFVGGTKECQIIIGFNLLWCGVGRVGDIKTLGCFGKNKCFGSSIGVGHRVLHVADDAVANVQCFLAINKEVTNSDVACES